MAGLSVYRDGSWQSAGGGETADRLPLPEVNAGDRIFAGLYAVYDHDANFAAMAFVGDVEIDWGDGTVEQVVNGQQAEHRWDYADLAGTESSRGYRQAIVTARPTGATWTTIDLTKRHSLLTEDNSTDTLLDCALAGEALSSVQLYTSLTIKHRMLERFAFPGGNSITSFVRFFRDLSSLASISTLDTSSSTSFSSMFDSCSVLQSLPVLDTSSGTDFSTMFDQCASLQMIPALDMSGGTDFSFMFDGCLSLAAAPLQGTASNISYANCRLSRAALVAIFEGLADLTGQTARTITVSGNWGATELTPEDIAIATDKNWTVAGAD